MPIVSPIFAEYFFSDADRFGRQNEIEWYNRVNPGALSATTGVRVLAHYK